MAFKEYAISFGIGASLSSTFNKSVQASREAFSTIEREIKNVEKAKNELDRLKKTKLIAKENKTKLKETKSQLELLKGKITETDEKAKALKSTYTNLEEKTVNLNTQKKNLENQLAKVAEKIKNNKSENKDLKEEYQKLKEETQKVNGKLTPLSEKFNQVKNSIKENQKESQDLRNQQLKLEDTIFNLRNKNKKYSETINQITKDFKEQKISVKDTANAYADLEKKMKRLEKAKNLFEKSEKLKERGNRIAKAGNIPLATGAAATGVAYSTLDTAIKAESAFAGVKKQFDFETKEDEEKFKKELLNLVSKKNIAVNLEELYGMAANAGQSGIKEDEAVGYVEAAANMAMAFNMGREEASEYMFAWKNTFKMGLPQLKELSDQINILGNNTGASEKKISEYLTRMGNMPKIIGMVESQTAALGATLMEMGMAPEVAATGSKKLLTILSKGFAATKTEKEALEKLGLNSVSLAKTAKLNPEKALELVFKRLSKVEGHEQGAVLSLLFGEEGKTAAANLMGAFEKYKKNSGLVKDKNLYNGAVEKESEVQKNTTANQLQVIKTEFDILKADLGTELLPLIKEGAKYTKEFLEKLRDFIQEDPERFKRLVKLFIKGTVALYALGATLKIAGAGIKLYSGLVKLSGIAIEKDFLGKIQKTSGMLFKVSKSMGSTGIKMAKSLGNGLIAGGKYVFGAIGTLGRASMAAFANPVGLTILGITALVAAGYLLYKNWDKVKEKGAELKDKVLELVDKYWFLMGPIGWIIKSGKKIYENWDLIKEKSIELKDKIAEFVVNSAQHWEEFKEKTMKILKMPFEWIEEKIETITSKAKGMVDGVMDIYNGIKDFSITDSISKGAKWVGDKVGINSETLSGIPQFANGGVVNRPTLALVGEGRSAESIIPHENTPRSLGLWERTGKLIGAYNNNTNNSENLNPNITITYAPVINSSNTTDIKEILKEDKEQFYNQFSEFMKRYSRENFRRGYGR